MQVDKNHTHTENLERDALKVTTEVTAGEVEEQPRTDGIGHT